MALTLPLFILLLLTLMIGIVLGSAATWFSQGRHRKRARDEAHEAKKWRDEAGRQRDRVEQMTAQKLISASK